MRVDDHVGGTETLLVLTKEFTQPSLGAVATNGTTDFASGRDT